MTGQEHALGDPAELAALYLAGAMTEAECAEFEAHIAAGCTVCDREMLVLDPLFAALADAAEAVPPSVQARIATLARANESLGELSPQQVEGVQSLVDEIDKILPELLEASRDWRPLSLAGVVLQRLGYDKAERRITALVRMAPGSSLPGHAHQAGEQCVVLHGELSIGERTIKAGEYRYWEPGETQPLQTTATGCLLLVNSPLD